MYDWCMWQNIIVRKFRPVRHEILLSETKTNYDYINIDSVIYEYELGFLRGWKKCPHPRTSKMHMISFWLLHASWVNTILSLTRSKKEIISARFNDSIVITSKKNFSKRCKSLVCNDRDFWNLVCTEIQNISTGV